MEFYEWDYLGYARAATTGYAEFHEVGPEILSKHFPLCPYCGARIGHLVWLPPYHVKLTTKKLGDLCTDGLSILVSKRFREAWNECNLKGLEFVADPVTTNMSEGDQMQYRVVRIPSTITRLDEAASGLEIEQLVGCEKCRAAHRKRVMQIRVDESTWDGLDAFQPSGLFGHALVTSRFVKMVKDAQLTNFHFIHQDDYSEPKTSHYSL